MNLISTCTHALLFVDYNIVLYLMAIFVIFVKVNIN